MESDTSKSKTAGDDRSVEGDDAPVRPDADTVARPKEIGGRKGPDPTRYGDWEKNGRCIDF